VEPEARGEGVATGLVKELLARRERCSTPRFGRIHTRFPQGLGGLVVFSVPKKNRRWGVAWIFCLMMSVCFTKQQQQHEEKYEQQPDEKDLIITTHLLKNIWHFWLDVAQAQK